MTIWHITRAVLAPATRNLGVLLADSTDGDAGHRLVWTLFPGDNAHRDFLYREADRGSFLIVSQRPAVDAHQIWRLDTKPYEPCPRAGERYSFILRANPSMDISRAGQRSLRVDAVMHAKRQAKARGERWTPDMERASALDWLYAREAAIGVRFDRTRCDASGYAQAALPRDDAARSRRAITYATIDYEGHLDVVDGARFAETLKTGIGRARAFGCGLMLIRRV